MHKLILTAIIGVMAGCFVHPGFLWSVLTAGIILFAALMAMPAASALLSVPSERYLPVKRLIYYSLCFLFALLYSSLWLNAQLSHRLPAELDRSYLNAQVQVEEITPHERGFRMRVSVLSLATGGMPDLRTLQLNWYPRGDIAVPATGSVVDIHALLRAPRNFANGLAFDYEAWLLSEGIDATGYIRSLKPTGETATQQRMSLSRAELLQSVQSGLPARAQPWVAGLIFGEQQAFTAEQWQLAAYSGTLHLLVVSGLHVGLIAALGWLAGGLFMRLSAAAGLTIAPHWLRLLPVILFTGVYVWIAGAGIALQRAWLMILLLALLSLRRQRPDWLDVVLAVMLIVLVVNPLIWLRPGFGFSFLAVLALLAGFRGRKNHRAEGLLLPQWLVFMALLPLLLWWGQTVGLQHLLANMVAIPLVTLIMMPLTFLVAMFPVEWLAQALVWSGDIFWHWLELIQSTGFPQFHAMSLLQLVLWYALLLLIWQGLPRWLGWFAQLLMLAAVVLIQPAPRNGAYMADVGQGLAMMFRQGSHTLMYDMGARFSDRFDAGSAIVFPLLQQTGAQQVHQIVISHNDNDHAGGLPGFLNKARLHGVAVHSVMAGQPQAGDDYTLCDDAAGRGWQRMNDDLLWRIFVIPLSIKSGLNPGDNNASCVIQVDWQGVRFLLPGDLESDAEAALVQLYGEELKSDVLVVGHHGSKTSSSDEFLQAVAPAQGWISAGFNNRFGHPHSSVTQRLKKHAVQILNTADCGLIHLQKPHQIHCRRAGWQAPWRQL